MSTTSQLVSFDHRAVTINGQRRLLLSGAFHYPRAEATEWRTILRRSRAAGLNCVESVVFWNLHEPARGRYDFTGRRDLRRFLDLVAEEGLHFILRIGPYICAEHNYGGLPVWLRDQPGMRIRTENRGFQEAMENWVLLLGDYLRPYSAAHGGPIVLVQMENEYGNIGKYYGEAGQRYLAWAVNLGARIRFDVPLILCDYQKFDAGFAQPVIQAINSFWAHEALPEHHRNNPGQPAIWTEHWTAWYDTWGYDHRRRSPLEVAASAARFFAAGGTGMNYYMWFGGTNFGRESMYLQTTSYDFDAPINEHGFLSTKGRHLARLHHILRDHEQLLLQSEPVTPTPLGDRQLHFRLAAGNQRLDFVCNDNTERAVTVKLDGRSHQLAPRAVHILRNGRLVYDSHQPERRDHVVPRRTVQPGMTRMRRAYWIEPMPVQRPVQTAGQVVATAPVEQLRLTADQSDYTWYSATLRVAGARTMHRLRVTHGGDFLRVFVDGKPAALSALPLREDRGRITGPGRGFTHDFQLTLDPGRHRLDILACALGLIKGDWSLGFSNMIEERKGIWGRVLLDGKPVSGPWISSSRLVGEMGRAWSEDGHLLPWRPAPPRLKATGRPTWWRLGFQAPLLPQGLSLDFMGLSKGMAWVNGHCLGRYWLIPTLQNATGQPTETPGEFTQRYYKVPFAWLNWRGDNHLVLFDEEGASPAQVRACTIRMEIERKTAQHAQVPTRTRTVARDGLTTTMTGIE